MCVRLGVLKTKRERRSSTAFMATHVDLEMEVGTIGGDSIATQSLSACS